MQAAQQHSFTVFQIIHKILIDLLKLLKVKYLESWQKQQARFKYFCWNSSLLSRKLLHFIKHMQDLVFGKGSILPWVGVSTGSICYPVTLSPCHPASPISSHLHRLLPPLLLTGPLYSQAGPASQPVKQYNLLMAKIQFLVVCMCLSHLPWGRGQPFSEME